MKADRTWEVIVVEDSDEDFELLKVAWKRAQVIHPLVRADNGEALLSHLGRPGARIALVVLDAKMAGKSGHEILRDMKANPSLSPIPVVMLSTSSSQTDISRAYEFGAASYLVKPDRLEGMTNLAGLLRSYWLETVELPGELGPLT